MEEHQLTPLCEICRKYGSDKGGWHLQAGDTCHNYTPAYHELFKDRREQVRNVLEIGVNYGCSLRMWRDYFPWAQIIGVDTNESCLFSEERIRCFAADQFNERDLADVLTRLSPLGGAPPKFDLIVDDGSHVADHQIFSAQCLLPHLAKDGYYVIEDIYPDCQPQRIGNRVVTDKKWHWHAIPTGHGLGKAHCGCGCGQGEQLVVFTWREFGLPELLAS